MLAAVESLCGPTRNCLIIPCRTCIFYHMYFSMFADHEWLFYDHMTVHHNRFLVNKTNLHWNPILLVLRLRVLGSLSAHHQFLAVHQLWYIWCSFDDHMLPGVGWFQPTPGSIWSSKLHQMFQSWCAAKNSWWWAERLPETCRVIIPIKLDFSASVGFIHKEDDWLITSAQLIHMFY